MILQAIGQVRESPGQLVNPVGTRTRTRVPRDIWSTARVSELIPRRLERWSTPQTLRHDRESPGKAGQPCGPSDTGPIRPGELVDHAGPRTHAKVTKKFGRHHGISGTGRDRPGQLVDPTGPRTRARVVLESWSTHLHSDPGLSCPGQLVNTTGTRKRARVIWDSWSTPRVHEHGTKSPGTAGRPRGHRTGHEVPGSAGRHRMASDPGLCHPGQQVNTASTQTRTQFTRDSWWNCGASDLGPGRKGELGEHEGPCTLARVAQESLLTPWDLAPSCKSSGTCGRPRKPRS